MKFCIQRTDYKEKTVATFEWSDSELHDLDFDPIDRACLREPIEDAADAAQNIHIIALKIRNTFLAREATAQGDDAA